MKKSKLICLLTLAFSLGGGGHLSYLANASEVVPTRIISNFGEDAATQMQITWQVNTTAAITQEIVYTHFADVTYSQAQKLDATITDWSLEFEIEAYNYAPRKICRASLTNLTPGVKYRYKVGSEGNYSTDYYFKTADNSNESDVVFFSDPQSKNYDDFYSTLSYAIGREENIDLFLCGGDISDLAGDEEYYKNFFNRGVNFFQNYQFATVPGNHETLYYAAGDENGYNYKEHPGECRAYNAHFFNPQNGPKIQDYDVNSTYYFYYNRTLFIMINTQFNSSDLRTTSSWIDEVIATSKANGLHDYTVAVMHKGVYGNYYYGNSGCKSLMDVFMPTFDKHKVDLVISGHDHTYVRTHTILDNKVITDTNGGTIYSIGGSVGPKLNTAKEGASEQKQFAVSYDKLSTGMYLKLHFDDVGINVEAVDRSGLVLDEYLIAKKSSEPRSLSTSVKAYSSKAEVAIDVSNRNNLEKITLERVNGDLINTYDMKTTSITIEGLTPNSKYDYLIRATYDNGESYISKFVINTISSLVIDEENKTLTINSDIDYDSYQVIINSVALEILKKNTLYYFLDYARGNYMVKVLLLKDQNVVDTDYILYVVS